MTAAAEKRKGSRSRSPSKRERVRVTADNEDDDADAEQQQRDAGEGNGDEASAGDFAHQMCFSHAAKLNACIIPCHEFNFASCCCKLMACANGNTMMKCSGRREGIATAREKVAGR